MKEETTPTLKAGDRVEIIGNLSKDLLALPTPRLGEVTNVNGAYIMVQPIGLNYPCEFLENEVKFYSRPEETTPTAGLQAGIKNIAETLAMQAVNTPAPLSEQKQEGETVEEAAYLYVSDFLGRFENESVAGQNMNIVYKAGAQWQSQNTAKQIEELQISVAVLELGNESKQVIINDRNEQIYQYKARIVELEELLKNSRNAIAELNETELQFGIQLCNDIDAAL